ncbi:MAG: histidine phosphatase family protein [Clostridia bacterium]|nr:histidine phosphatase family protein [Clostridia bacterium]
MVNLILVRHGFSESNKNNFFSGRIDVKLCDIGLTQAELVSDYIIKNYKIDVIYSSPLSRTIDTIKKVSTVLNLPINLDNDLIEFDGGKWEGLSFKDVEKYNAEYYAKWSTNKGTVRCPDGESMEEAGKRALKAIDKICKKHDGQTVLISTHGGVLRSLQCLFNGFPMEKLNDMPWTPNASISIVQYDNGKYKVVQYGITDHLAELSTNLPNF